MAGAPRTEEVAALLGQAGLAGPFTLTPLPGGANNRVYRVDSSAGASLLKAYFQHPGDPRDRLGTEFAFSRFAWDRGLRCLPRPQARDEVAGLALYEFVAGQTLPVGAIGPEEVRQAAVFFRQLNAHRSHPEARNLPAGSEACFALERHLACVERRIAGLARLDDSTPLGRRAVQLVERELVPAWEAVRGAVVRGIADAGLSLEEALPESERVLSPSDFGFHNALRAADGTLRFFDFEYAGWDDPAKMVCDFACQPAVPVPPALIEGFTREGLGFLSGLDRHQRRIALLLPVYHIKWCCILLNDFQPVGAQRRAFAREAEDRDERRRQQLQKVRALLRGSSVISNQ